MRSIDYQGFHDEELRQKKKENYQGLYRCIRNSDAVSISACVQCMNKSGRSYCRCIHGLQYCGSKLYMMGWKNFDNNKVYECIADGNDVKKRSGIFQQCQKCCKANLSGTISVLFDGRIIFCQSCQSEIREYGEIFSLHSNRHIKYNHVKMFSSNIKIHSKVKAFPVLMHAVR